MTSGGACEQVQARLDVERFPFALGPHALHICFSVYPRFVGFSGSRSGVWTPPAHANGKSLRLWHNSVPGPVLLGIRRALGMACMSMKNVGTQLSFATGRRESSRQSQSCFLAIVLAEAIHCNVVDISDGGRHLAQHSYCHGRKGRPRSTPGVTRSYAMRYGSIASHHVRSLSRDVLLCRPPNTEGASCGTLSRRAEIKHQFARIEHTTEMDRQNPSISVARTWQSEYQGNILLTFWVIGIPDCSERGYAYTCK